MDVPQESGQAVSPGENRVTKKPFLKGLSFSRAYRFLLLSDSGGFYQLNEYDHPMRKHNRFFLWALAEWRPARLLDKPESLDKQATLQRFITAMASLSCTEQHLFYLRYYQEFSLNELATVSGLSTRAIRMRLRRIDRKLEQSCLRQLAG